MPLPSPRTLLPTTRLPAIPSGHGSQQLALQFQLERTQWWTTAELEAAQFKTLRLLLDHARETTPYYRERFARAGYDHKAALDPAAWLRVPVSRRRDLQQAGDSLFSARPPAAHGKVVAATTSGSTGQPLRFARNEVTMTYWRAFTLRDLVWHDEDTLPKIGAIRFAPVGQAEAPHGVSSPHWNNSTAVTFPTGPAVMLNVASSLDEQFAWLERERPQRLTSFPSNFLALGEHARRTGRALPRTGRLRCVGEMLTPEARATIAADWGGKVVDLYSCEEAGYLALECPEHGSYHVQAENVKLEILDEQDKPCPPGTPGRVVITSLHNFASPLIRMDLGDYAELGEPCPCGRGLPVIRRILGRSRNRLVLPNGETRYPRIGEKAIAEAAEGVTVFRFLAIQHSLEMVEMQIVASRPLDAAEQARLAVSIQQNLGHPFRITFSFPADIPAQPNGKRETFVSLIHA
ncbi:MAG: phenylacetate--CoA ligase family protein [Verrucomicrobia bacterium]|nr:phenylacetate--CoA ligase family protein [Verrucomicrobiota bacterium]